MTKGTFVLVAVTVVGFVLSIEGFGGGRSKFIEKTDFSEAHWSYVG